jgi:hypothetical protein
MIGLKEVYKIDAETGNVIGLEDISSKLAPAIPKCPHCQRPVRQYVTQRYNRLINRAVIDEMSKRFIVTGQTDLQKLESALAEVEAELEATHSDVTTAKLTNVYSRDIRDVTQKLQNRYRAATNLRSEVVRLQRRATERHQPAHKLFQATVHAVRRNATLESGLTGLNLRGTLLTDERDHRIILGAQMIRIKLDGIAIEDRYRVFSAAKPTFGDSATPLAFSKGSPSISTRSFLESCAQFVTDCNEKALPRLAVEASLYYARVARLFKTAGLLDPEDRDMADEYHHNAMKLLEGAEELCVRGFRNADTLSQAVSELLKLSQKGWHEPITKAELEAIKRAMVSGPKGIASHSGHWYNCANGHPVRWVLAPGYILRCVLTLIP